jgi:carboxyl-terminal processing protease
MCKKWISLIFAISLTLSAAPVNAAENRSKLQEKDLESLMKTVSAVHHYYYKDIPLNQLFEDAAKGMLEELDPHSVYLNEKDRKALEASISGSFVGIGIEISPDKDALRVIAPLDGSPAAVAGIRANDLILRINGQLITTEEGVAEAVGKIRGKVGTSIDLTILHQGAKEPQEITVVRRKVKYKAVKSELLFDHYGYLRISMFQGPVAGNLVKAIHVFKRQAKPLKGIVLDLRSNPGGLLTSSVDVSNLFLTPGELKRYGGTIVAIKGRAKESNEIFRAKGSHLLQGIPVIVLINSGSASASEIVAGALQDYKRAVIVGTRSFGKGSVQTVIPLNKEAAIKLTTALYYTPANQQIQANGIIPDVYAPALVVKKEDSEHYFRFGESDYGNHVKNGVTDSATVSRRVKEAAYHEALLKLAAKDSQLYEAVSLLEAKQTLSSYSEK